MDRLIYTAMTGAAQILNRQAAVANNLANLSTTGYKMEEHRLRAVPVIPAIADTLATRAFVADASTHTDFSPGALHQTGRALDMAVQGKGWMALAMPDGTEAYTRNGSLEISVNGVLQTRGGLPVQGDGGTISVPPDSKITIAADGTVSVIPESGSQNTVAVIGRLKRVNPSEQDLVRGTDGLFRLASGDPAPADDAVQLAGGYLETSNVNAADQMVAMISLGRQFELQMRMLSTAEANDKAATQILSIK